LEHVCGTCTPKHVLNRLHSLSSAEKKHACRQYLPYLHRSKRKSTQFYTQQKKKKKKNTHTHTHTHTSFLQTLISLCPSDIRQNVNLPRFTRRCPSECIFLISNFRCVLYVVCFLLVFVVCFVYSLYVVCFVYLLYVVCFVYLLYVVCFLLGNSPASEFSRRKTTQKKTYKCIFSLPGQVHSYFVQPGAIHRVRQSSYSFPVSINDVSTLR
jgi:hypothetical protein